MTSSYSVKDLGDFLDWASSKGLLKQATAQSRKVAALKVLGALDPSEQEDLRAVDRDGAFQRFVNKFGGNFTPDSLVTYRSRFNSALEDFLRYRNDPTSFKFAAPQKAGKANGNSRPGKGSDTAEKSRTPARAAPLPAASSATPFHTEVVFPIPIRDGVIVRVHNLPANLTRAEAQRIAAVILALAVPDESGKEST